MLSDMCVNIYIYIYIYIYVYIITLGLIMSVTCQSENVLMCIM